ncbi:transposase [Parashewanella hymeniacidonis]|uniref:IS1/IS1595 family N-terminal zinc-binding domain-containing protein n=1 Tax=Parashewanella hymeniacidonis TaxID=2807618 RepID=UPI0023E897F7|nr:transposase [Parashewanella hymeniacidonis]
MEIFSIVNLISNKKCYERVRQLRWKEGVTCPHCDSKTIKKNGHDITQKDCQHYQCKTCQRYFDDLTNTVFAGHHQPLKIWITCLYFMGLNLSNNQIAKELNLHKSDVHNMVNTLRSGVIKRKPEVLLKGEVEFDEMYLVAGHKGNPEAIKKSGAKK